MVGLWPLAEIADKLEMDPWVHPVIVSLAILTFCFARYARFTWQRVLPLPIVLLSLFLLLQPDDPAFAAAAQAENVTHVLFLQRLWLSAPAATWLVGLAIWFHRGIRPEGSSTSSRPTKALA